MAAMSWHSGFRFTLKHTVRPPDLSAAGYQLMSGRLLATEEGNASALFLYETVGGSRLSLLMRPMTADLTLAETGVSRGEWNICAWIEHGMGYALVAATPHLELDQLSDRIRAAFQPGIAPPSTLREGAHLARALALFD